MKVIRFLTNRIGWTLVAINGAILLFGIYLRGGFHQFLHFYYEPIPIWIYAFLNFPALVLTDWLVELTLPIHGQASKWNHISGLEFFTTIFFGFVQWYSIGLLITRVRSLAERRTTSELK